MPGGSPVRQRRDAASRFALRARFSLVDNPNKHMLLTHDPGPSPRHPSLAIHTPHPSMTLLERAQHLQDYPLALHHLRQAMHYDPRQRDELMSWVEMVQRKMASSP